jgi:hypothetical protein
VIASNYKPRLANQSGLSFFLVFSTRRASAPSRQVLNAWLCNQAFQFHGNIKIFQQLNRENLENFQ